MLIPTTTILCRMPKEKKSYDFCPPCSTTPVLIVKPIGLCALCEDDEPPSVITNECIVRLHPLQVVAVSTNGGERGEAEVGPVSVARREEAEGEDVTALLDTGSRCRDFISPALAARLIERGAVLVPTRARVCLAQLGHSIPVTHKLKLMCKYQNVESSTLDQFSFEPSILPNLSVDLIIGLHTIFNRELFYKMILMPRKEKQTEHGANSSPTAPPNRSESFQG